MSRGRSPGSFAVAALVVACAASPGCRRTRPAAAEIDLAHAAPALVHVSCDDTGCPRAPLMPAGPQPSPGGRLVVHLEAEPPTLCDLIEHDAWSRWIVENQIGETLLEQDPWTGRLAPRLAESLTRDARTRRLTLALRSGVRWHDGRPFGAADVRFTLERARDPAVGADQASELERVSRILTPDERTVVLELSGPAPFLPQSLAHLAILPRHAFPSGQLRGAPAARAPIGTGPLRFVRWEPGSEIVVSRNADYWGRPAWLDEISFRVVRDRRVALELYRRGELDLLWRVPAGVSLAELSADPRLGGHRDVSWPLRAYGFVVWNTARPPLDDPRVRRALSLLIDRARYARVALDDSARAVTGPYLPGTASYDPDVPVDAYSPGAARALLAEAGAGRFSIELLVTAGSRSAEQLGTMLREDAAPLGIDVSIVPVDWAVQLDRLRRHAFSASVLQWTLALEQDNFPMFHSSQAAAGQNYGSFSDPEVDSLLERIRLTEDDDERHDLDRQLHRALAAARPYAFLFAQRVHTLIAPGIGGIEPSAAGFRFDRAWKAPATR